MKNQNMRTEMQADDGTEEAEEHTHPEVEPDQPCPYCGRKPTPNGKDVWNAILAQMVYDSFNIGVFVGGLLTAVSLLTGKLTPGYVGVALTFFAIVMALDVIAIVHKLVSRGFPFRHVVDDGPLS